jgi:hypothetical protein
VSSLLAAAFVVAIFSFRLARTSYHLFAATLLSAKLILAAGFIAGGLWDSLRARSWRILLLWMLPVPL